MGGKGGRSSGVATLSPASSASLQASCASMQRVSCRGTRSCFFVKVFRRGGSSVDVNIAVIISSTRVLMSMWRAGGSTVGQRVTAQSDVISLLFKWLIGITWSRSQVHTFNFMWWVVARGTHFGIRTCSEAVITGCVGAHVLELISVSGVRWFGQGARPLW